MDVPASHAEEPPLQHGPLRLSCVAENRYNAAKKQPIQAWNEQAWTQTASTAQWSPDGTCILTTRADNTLETFVLPQDLLEPDSFHDLTQYSTFTVADPIYATAIHPSFNLQDPSTTLVLHSSRSRPLHLTNALAHSSGTYASYPLTNPTTEAWIAPSSLLFTRSGTHILTGAQSLLAVFDVSRPGSGPIERHRTGRRIRNHHGQGRKGLDWSYNITGPKDIISAMDISSAPDATLAIGTFNRVVALYANSGLGGEVITSFSLRDSENAGFPPCGAGVSQLRWSLCGRYLFVAERRSQGIAVYDIRGTGRRLSWLAGREADTNVRLGFDIVPIPGGDGCEVWAGGTDGKVRVWRDVERKGGTVSWEEEFVVHDDPVCAALVHQSGSVLATLSYPDRYKENDAGEENEDTSSEPSDSEDDGSSKSSSNSQSEANDDDEDGDGKHHAITTKTSTPKAKDPRLKIWAIRQ